MEHNRWKDDEKEALAKADFVKEFLNRSSAEEKKTWWEKLLSSAGLLGALGIIGVVAGAAITAVSNYKIQKLTIERQAQIALERDWREKRLDVALQVERQTGKLLMGSENLATVAGGRFDESNAAAASWVESANQEEAAWRRERDTLELQVRHYYGEEVMSAWKELRAALDDYVSGVQTFYMEWRQAVVQKNPRQKHLAASAKACAGKREAIQVKIERFAAAVQAEWGAKPPAWISTAPVRSRSAPPS